MVEILAQTEKYDAVEVAVGKAVYPIYIGDVLEKLTEFVGNSKYSSVMVLTDSNLVKAGHLKTVLDALKKSGKKNSHGILRAGEQFKHKKYYSDMIDAVDEVELDRKTLLVALGGGVIGDEVGFVAATYLRGVDLLQMPTTPLSGADSSIGGKVGLDTDKGKNRIGDTKQPIAVFQHTPFYQSLKDPPIKHYGYDSGWAETVKHAGIDDGLHPQLGTQEKFIDYLEKNLEGLISFDEKVIRHCMLRNAIIKGNIVEIDEKESGMRVGLNFGHTFGHAFETFMNRILLERDPSGATVYPHGDAVGVGVHYAAWLSLLKGAGLTKSQLNRQLDIYQRLEIKTKLPKEAQDTFEEIYSFMSADKKAISGMPQFVLQERLGQLQKTGDAQPDGSEAKGGYYLQPIEREVLKKAFEMIK